MPLRFFYFFQTWYHEQFFLYYFLSLCFAFSYQHRELYDLNVALKFILRPDLAYLLRMRTSRFAVSTVLALLSSWKLTSVDAL